MRIISVFILVAVLFFSCRKQDIIVQSPVVEDVIVNHEMAVQLGYASDTVYTCYIPNTITLEQNNVNDFFGPKGFGDWKEFYMEIRNKFNDRIFSTRVRTERWDGKHRGYTVAEGVYQYYIEIKTGVPDMLHKYTGGVAVVK